MNEWIFLFIALWLKRTFESTSDHALNRLTLIVGITQILSIRLIMVEYIR